MYPIIQLHVFLLSETIILQIIANYSKYSRANNKRMIAPILLLYSFAKLAFNNSMNKTLGLLSKQKNNKDDQ